MWSVWRPLPENHPKFKIIIFFSLCSIRTNTVPHIWQHFWTTWWYPGHFFLLSVWFTRNKRLLGHSKSISCFSSPLDFRPHVFPSAPAQYKSIPPRFLDCWTYGFDDHFSSNLWINQKKLRYCIPGMLNNMVSQLLTESSSRRWDSRPPW